MRKRILIIAVAAGLLAATAFPAGAQTQRAPPPGGGNAQAMQQLASERTALQAENSRLKKELESAKSQAAAAGREAAGGKSGAADLKAALAKAQEATKAAEQERDQTRTRLQDLLERFRQTTGSLAGVETERAQLKSELGALSARYDICAQRNVELFEVMNEALDKLDHRGFFSAVAGVEPITRIERNRLENMIDEYKVRAEALKLPPAPASSGTGH